MQRVRHVISILPLYVTNKSPYSRLDYELARLYARMGDQAEARRHLELVLSGKPLETNVQSRKGTWSMDRGFSDLAWVAHDSNREVQFRKRDLCQGARRARRIGAGQSALSVLLQYHSAHRVSRVGFACETTFFFGFELQFVLVVLWYIMI